MMKCIQVGCGRTDDDIGKCGQSISCPTHINPAIGATPVEENGRDIIIHCENCDITRVYPTASFMAGSSIHSSRLCKGINDVCFARASTLTAKKASSTKTVSE